MSFIYWQPVLLRTSELPLNNWHGHLHLHIWSFFLPLSWLLFLVEAPSLREESTKSKTAQAPALPVSVSAGVSGVEATKRAAAGSALVTKKPSGSTSKGHIFVTMLHSGFSGIDSWDFELQDNSFASFHQVRFNLFFTIWSSCHCPWQRGLIWLNWACMNEELP